MKMETNTASRHDTQESEKQAGHIREVVVVEGRDDERAVRVACSADTIATHGFGIRKETWDLLERAARERGLIILTDPDHAGEMIRKKLSERFPEAKHAWVPRRKADQNGNIGIENAAPDSIRQALAAVRTACTQATPQFSRTDLILAELTGSPDAASRRDQLGTYLGIGYGNSRTFLNRLNMYQVTREEFHSGLLFMESGEADEEK